MDFTKQNKDTLQAIADEVGIVVEAKKEGKPTKDELVAGLEEFEKEDPEAIKAAAKKLEIEDKDETEKEDTEVEKTKGSKAKADDSIWTYIGGGEASPRKINFMGKQEFIRGKATVVTDPEVLAKIKGNPTFVKGEADEETLHKIDEEAEREANEQRAADLKINAEFAKKHNKE